MINYSQSLEIDGLTVSLSFSADNAALYKLLGDSPGEVSAEDLEEAIQKALQEMPQTLLSAREAICRSLLQARISSIKADADQEDEKVEPLQKITIKKNDDGTIVISHKHRDFTAESFGSTKSVKGTLNALENLLNGYLPDPFDLSNKSDEQQTIHFKDRKAPRPLD